MKKSFLSIMVDFVLYPYGRVSEKSDTKSGIDLSLVATPTQYELERELELGNLTMGRCKGKSIVSDIYGACTKEDKEPAAYSVIVDDHHGEIDTNEIKRRANKFLFDSLDQANKQFKAVTPITVLAAKAVVEEEAVLVREVTTRYLERVGHSMSDYNLKAVRGHDGTVLYYMESKKNCNVVKLVTFKAPYFFNNYGNEFKTETSYEVHQK